MRVKHAWSTAKSDDKRLVISKRKVLRSIFFFGPVNNAELRTLIQRKNNNLYKLYGKLNIL